MVLRSRLWRTRGWKNQIEIVAPAPNGTDLSAKPSVFVIPAKTGIQCFWSFPATREYWIPAFAGMTALKTAPFACVLFFFVARFYGLPWAAASALAARRARLRALRSRRSCCHR